VGHDEKYKVGILDAPRPRCDGIRVDVPCSIRHIPVEDKNFFTLHDETNET